MGGMSSVHLLGKAPGRVRTQQRDEDHQRRERQAHGVNEHDRAERPAQREDKLKKEEWDKIKTFRGWGREVWKCGDYTGFL